MAETAAVPGTERFPPPRPPVVGCGDNDNTTALNRTTRLLKDELLLEIKRRREPRIASGELGVATPTFGNLAGPGLLAYWKKIVILDVFDVELCCWCNQSGRVNRLRVHPSGRWELSLAPTKEPTATKARGGGVIRPSNPQHHTHAILICTALEGKSDTNTRVQTCEKCPEDGRVFNV